MKTNDNHDKGNRTMTRTLIALAVTTLISAPSTASAAFFATATAQWGDLPDMVVYAEATEAAPVQKADVEIGQPLTAEQCCDLPDAVIFAQTHTSAPTAAAAGPITLLTVTLGFASLFAVVRFAIIRQ